ncbi:coiled-coil-helix-coiled-coil-helix domain-containing protein 7-like isoform X2 [Anneissia japonica]|uniref:coiled-coil-helix-coiled-coil-helix domain-containing protein 7-like isoform X2 n=1 Tax=Anneissia japonica TaxID=1529436 RepID=UPI0014259928|nr:coiled-coil-helix-coiled-coil-helix domain-containing protein 7-like isoform X2 [Anneissia japonica]
MQTENASRIEADRIRSKRNPGYADQTGKKLANFDNNPCLEEADASYRCLHENNFDRDSCTKYFLNYKNCRKFWGNFALDRRRNGIKPALPAKEERDKILENLSLK